MSVPVQVPITGPYTANGSTKQFAYRFYLLLEEDLEVWVGGQKKVLHTHYEVTGVGNSTGGNVEFSVAPAAGLEVIIKRATPFTRQTDYADNGDLLAEVVNDDFDRLWLALQEINANFGSSISRPIGGNWDATSLRITNLADGTQPQDAVTLAQLTNTEGSAAASAQAAATSAQQTAADRQQTGADRTQTGNDRLNVANNTALARQWASNPVDTVVADGFYSALHYATKAAGSASTASTAATTATDQAVASSASATAASGSATTATQQADRAKTEADKLGNMNQLAAAISAIDAANNVTWKSKLTLGSPAVNDFDVPTFKQVNDAKKDAQSANSAFSVLRGSTTAPANGAVVYGGDLASKYQVAGADWATARLRVKATGGTTPLRQVALGLDEAGVAKEWLLPATAGTLALNNDARFGTIDGKTGGYVTGAIMSSFTSDTAAQGFAIGTSIKNASGYEHTKVTLLPELAANGNRYAHLIITQDASFKEWYFDYNQGNAYAPASWVNLSDVRIKNGIKRISDPLDKMRQVHGCTWTRIDDQSKGNFGIGFIAQEIQKIFPEAISTGMTGSVKVNGETVVDPLTLPTGEVAAALHHEAILALMDQIDELKKQVATLAAN